MLPLRAAVGVIEALWSARAAAASGAGLLADCRRELIVGGIDGMGWDDPDLRSAPHMCDPDSGHQVQQSAGAARPPAVSTQALFQRTLIHLLPAARRHGEASVMRMLEHLGVDHAAEEAERAAALVAVAAAQGKRVVPPPPPRPPISLTQGYGMWRRPPAVSRSAGYRDLD
jgi:hypothetical protein